MQEVWRLTALEGLAAAMLPPSVHGGGVSATYGDEKVANRDIRVWHFATENGP